MADNAIYRAQPVLERIDEYVSQVSTEVEIFNDIGELLGLQPVNEKRSMGSWQT